MLFSARALKPCQVEIRYTVSLPSFFFSSVLVSMEKETVSIGWKGIAAWSDRWQGKEVCGHLPGGRDRASKPGAAFSFCRYRQKDVLLSVVLLLQAANSFHVPFKLLFCAENFRRKCHWITQLQSAWALNTPICISLWAVLRTGWKLLLPSYVTSGILLANLKQLKGKKSIAELQRDSSEVLKKFFLLRKMCVKPSTPGGSPTRCHREGIITDGRKRRFLK